MVRDLQGGRSACTGPFPFGRARIALIPPKLQSVALWSRARRAGATVHFINTTDRLFTATEEAPS